jgi:predicted Zn-dependent peptidase
MPILGTQEDVESFTPDRLLSHFRKYYTPGNAIVTASGRVDHDALTATCARLFGSLSNEHAESQPFDTPQTNNSIIVMEKDLEHIYLCVGTGGVSQVDHKRYALYILNALMGGSMSSHLFQEVREKRGLVYNIYSYVNCFHDTGTFGIATSTSGEFLGEVLGLVKEEIVRIRDKGITDEELEFSKEHIKGNLFISMESSEARMGRLAKNEIYFGGYIPLKETLREIAGIQKSLVNDVAREIFRDPRDISLAVLGNAGRKEVETLWKT